MPAANQLLIFLADDPDTIMVCRPPHLGRRGRRISSSSVPLYLSATAVEAMSGALALISEAGIDRRTYMEFLTATVFKPAPYTTYGSLAPSTGLD